MSALHVVLGGTGGVGAAIVTELLEHGLPVRAVSRSGRAEDGAEGVAADVRDPLALRAALRGAAVVYHAAQPAYTRWPQDFPPLTRGIVDGVAAMGAKLVFADNLYCYGAVPGGYGPGTPAGPLTERSAVHGSGRKGAVRAAMADALLAAHRAGRLPVTIGRLADYHGPGGMQSSVGADLFRAVLAGKPATWAGPADHLHSFTFLPDAARALVRLGLDTGADGRVWHLPVAEPLTPRAFVHLAGEIAGTSGRLRSLPVWVLRAAGVVVPLAREIAELAYQVDRPFVVDAAAYTSRFGSGGATPHEDALAVTLAWFANRPGARTGS